MSTDSLWLDEFYRNARSKSEDAALQELFDHMKELVESRDLSRCDEWLAAFEPVQVEPLFSAAALRYTFPLRSRLDSWEPLFKNCYRLFQCQGLDAFILFRRLFASAA